MSLFETFGQIDKKCHFIMLSPSRRQEISTGNLFEDVKQGLLDAVATFENLYFLILRDIDVSF